MRAQLETLRAVARNAELRRLQIAWMWTSIGVWGGVLALSVYAYDEGGAAAVGVMALVRALPGAPAAPLLALWVDRTSRRRVMLLSSLVRAALMFAIAGAVAAGAPLGVTYALVGLLAIVGPAFRPALLALTPRAARTPTELSAASVTGSLVNNTGFFVSSLLIGALLAVTSVEAVFALLGAAFAATMVPLLRIAPDDAPEGDPEESAMTEMAAGFQSVRRDSALRELVLISAALTFIDGALDVLVVVAALGFLDAGEAGAGALTAVWGAGCVVGGGVVLLLLSRGHLTRGILLGSLVFGVAVAVVGLVPVFVVALLALLVYGIGYTLVEVAAATLLQRLTPDHVLGRVGGVTETTTVATLAVGSLTAGLLAEAIGAEAALVVVGMLVPLLVLVRRKRLVGMEAGVPVAEREYQLLRSHEIFAPLSVAASERLANALREVRPDVGEEVIRQGDHGDRFYLVAEGELDVYVDGEHRRVCGPGDGIGEIALVRDVPRTATVRAGEGVVLLALDRATFLEAVASQRPASRAAHRIADERHALS